MTATDLKQAHINEYNAVAARIYEHQKQIEAEEKRLTELRVIIATAERFEQAEAKEEEGSD